MRVIVLFVIFLTLAIKSYSQESLVFYCDVMANGYLGETREVAASKFNALFRESLSKTNSFKNTYQDLKWVSIKYDKAKTFRVITWQLKNKEDKYQYFGLIQKQDDSVIELKDMNIPTQDNEYEQNDASSWIGALYYNMLEVTSEGKIYYMLFGYDGNDGISHFKICDVLTFDERGNPIFGNEFFLIKDGQRPDLKSRIILQYSTIANVNFNFNEGMDMIVHDYIIARAGITPTEPISRIPDGTYTGYKWDGKYWRYKEKIEHQISSESEIFYQPKPKESEKKDIFGNRKG